MPVEASGGAGLLGRVDTLLTRDRLTVYPLVVLILFVLTWVVALRTNLPLPDHLARWTAGRLVLDGQGSALYDPAAQSALQAEVGATALSWFVSPPYVALLFVPFGALPYPLSAVVWTVVSVTVTTWSLLAVARLHPGLATLGTRRTLFVVLSCQPVLELFGSGQDSGLVLVALVAGVLLRRRGHRFAAGVVLGLTLVKPQLAVLIPLALLALRDWRALAGMATSATGLVAAATVALGSPVWPAWLDTLRSPLYLTEVVAGQAWKDASLHGLVETVVPGLGGWLVTSCWVFLAVTVILVTARAWRSPRVEHAAWLLLAVVPFTTVLVTPHAYVYDLALLLPATVWLVAAVRSVEARALVAVGYLLLFLAPPLRLVTAGAPWPVSALGGPWVVLVLAAVWWLWLRKPRPDRSVDDRPCEVLRH